MLFTVYFFFCISLFFAVNVQTLFYIRKTTNHHALEILKILLIANSIDYFLYFIFFLLYTHHDTHLMESYLKSFINFNERTNVRLCEEHLSWNACQTVWIVCTIYVSYLFLFCFFFLSRIYLRLKLTEIVVIFIHYVLVMNWLDLMRM